MIKYRQLLIFKVRKLTKFWKHLIRVLTFDYVVADDSGFLVHVDAAASQEDGREVLSLVLGAQNATSNRKNVFMLHPINFSRFLDG